MLVKPTRCHTGSGAGAADYVDEGDADVIVDECAIMC